MGNVHGAGTRSRVVEQPGFKLGKPWWEFLRIKLGTEDKVRGAISKIEKTERAA